MTVTFFLPIQNNIKNVVHTLSKPIRRSFSVHHIFDDISS